jgi:hypothetical protein
MELALIILEYADYSARVIGERHERVDIAASRGTGSELVGLYVSTPSIPVADAKSGEKYKITYVEFKMRASDQGWASQGDPGTYNGSYTWFEASILRATGAAPFTEPLDTIFPRTPPYNYSQPTSAGNRLREHGWDFVQADDGSVSWPVQYNICAKSEPKEHTVRWEVGKETEVLEGDGHYDGKDFLDQLQQGDRVVLWARARVSLHIFTYSG